MNVKMLSTATLRKAKRMSVIVPMVANGDHSRATLIEFAENPKDEDKETKK